jgi:hypothetical protein
MTELRVTMPDRFVTEGIHGTFRYHLSETRSGRALCGARVMLTHIPVSAWGTVSHLGERWCAACEKAGR